MKITCLPLPTNPTDGFNEVQRPLAQILPSLDRPCYNAFCDFIYHRLVYDSQALTISSAYSWYLGKFLPRCEPFPIFDARWLTIILTIGKTHGGSHFRGSNFQKNRHELVPRIHEARLSYFNIGG